MGFMESQTKRICDGMVNLLCNNTFIAPNQSILLKSKGTHIVFSNLDGVASVHSPNTGHHEHSQELNKVFLDGSSSFVCNFCKDMRLQYGYRHGCDISYSSISGQVEDLEEEGGLQEEKDVGESQKARNADSSASASFYSQANSATEDVSRLASVSFHSNDQGSDIMAGNDHEMEKGIRSIGDNHVFDDDDIKEISLLTDHMLKDQLDMDLQSHVRHERVRQTPDGRGGGGGGIQRLLQKRVPSKENCIMSNLLKRLDGDNTIVATSSVNSEYSARVATAAPPPHITRSVVLKNPQIQLYDDSNNLQFLVHSLLEAFSNEIGSLLQTTTKEIMASQLSFGDIIYDKLCLIDDVVTRGSAIIQSNLKGNSHPKVTSKLHDSTKKSMYSLGLGMSRKAFSKICSFLGMGSKSYFNARRRNSCDADDDNDCRMTRKEGVKQLERLIIAGLKSGHKTHDINCFRLCVQSLDGTKIGVKLGVNFNGNGAVSGLRTSHTSLRDCHDLATLMENGDMGGVMESQHATTMLLTLQRSICAGPVSEHPVQVQYVKTETKYLINSTMYRSELLSGVQGFLVAGNIQDNLACQQSAVADDLVHPYIPGNTTVDPPHPLSQLSSLVSAPVVGYAHVSELKKFNLGEFAHACIKNMTNQVQNKEMEFMVEAETVSDNGECTLIWVPFSNELLHIVVSMYDDTLGSRGGMAGLNYDNMYRRTENCSSKMNVRNAANFMCSERHKRFLQKTYDWLQAQPENFMIPEDLERERGNGPRVLSIPGDKKRRLYMTHKYVLQREYNRRDHCQKMIKGILRLFQHCPDMVEMGNGKVTMSGTKCRIFIGADDDNLLAAMNEQLKFWFEQLERLKAHGYKQCLNYFSTVTLRNCRDCLYGKTSFTRHYTKSDSFPLVENICQGHLNGDSHEAYFNKLKSGASCFDHQAAMNALSVQSQRSLDTYKKLVDEWTGKSSPIKRAGNKNGFRSVYVQRQAPGGNNEFYEEGEDIDGGVGDAAEVIVYNIKNTNSSRNKRDRDVNAAKYSTNHLS